MKRQIHLCRRWVSQRNLKQLITCLLCFFFCHLLPASAQKVDFDANKWSGCEPLAVQFQNLSDPGYTSLNWSFSVGADVTDPNPARIFNTPGAYKITLTATYPGGVVIKQEKTVTVYRKPAPAFSTSVPGGCAPLPVTFTDQSSPGDGTITSVTWDFGDGINGSGSSATHTYTLGGTQTASIIVINSFGCTNGTTRQITVQDAPTVRFTSDVQGSCTTPLTVNFQNSSSMIDNSPLTYLWDFGDGATSTAAAPQHTYTTEGRFTVSLTATSTGGCRQTLTAPQYIQIMRMQPDFSTSGSVCVNQPVTLVNNTQPTPLTAQWEFPDGSIRYGTNTSFVFTQPGDYTIRMTATGTGGCQESISKTITVHPEPVADFTASPNPSCRVPTTVNFAAQTTGATSWTWDFGAGTGSGQNPSHTYTAAGFYNVSLLATNAFGCSVGVSKANFVQLQPPTLSFYTDMPSGCIPFTANFFPYVTSVDPIVRYSWNFGDGATSSLEQPSHNYTVRGTYTVTLEIETQTGCRETYSMTILAGERVVVDFDVDKTKGCQSDLFHFTNRSVPRGTDWLWNFPQDNSTASGENPTHQFSEMGHHDVTLTVIDNGCQSVLTKPLLIEIFPPIARFNVAPDCVNKYDRQFNDASDFGPGAGPRSWLWEFGDGTTSTQQHPLHTFPRPGAYTVRLTVDNGSCTSNISQIVYIIDEKPVIASNVPMVCSGRSISFTITNPLTYNMIRNYSWDFGDGTYYFVTAGNFDPNAVYTHTYNSPGNYNVILRIEDINGCPHQSNTLQVTINGVAADFTFSGNCRENPFTFTDASVPAFPTTNITSWAWDFGDGTAPVTLTQKPNNYAHSFAEMLNYPVTLTVTDQFGCTSSITKPVSINVVNASIVVPQQEACMQKAFNFSNNSYGNALTYAWSFGDGGTSTEAAPEHIYTAVGVYTIRLTVTDADGCKDSREALNFITVRNPQAAFTTPPNLAPCPPVLVPFTNTSADYDGVAWQFGDGSTSPEISPGHAYSRPGTYTVQLRVYTEGGCSSIATKDVVIQGPDGTQSSTPTTGCMPLRINMSAQSSNAVKYIWDFDDGQVVTTTTPTTDHEYTKEGIYRPRVILEDAKGCQVPALGDDRIVADKVTPRFTMDATEACDSGYVYFQDNSLSITQDSLGLAMTYAWDFGMPGRTDDVATGANPRFFYDQVGTYPVKLIVTSAYGCTGEITLPAVVEPKPEPAIMPLTAVCAGTEVRLRGQEGKALPGTKWQWRVDPDQVFDVQDPPMLTFNTPGSNRVQLTISNGNGSCPVVVEAIQEVNALPALNPMPKMANICLGQSLELQSNTEAGTEVNWTDYHISDPRSPTPVVNPDRDTIYHVLAVNSFGCTRESDIAISVTHPHTVNIADVTICQGSKVQLHASGGTRYRWIPETGLDRADAASPIASPEVTTTYQVIGYGDNICFTDTAEATVTVNPTPVVNAGPDQVVTVGSELRLQLQTSPDVNSIQWQPATGLSCADCPAPLAMPKSSITYFVTATNQYNCVSKDAVNIQLVCESSVVFLPNTFSPNGDGQNDIFYVRGRGIKTVKVFRVFNRWGQQVFERSNLNTEDPTSGWDGTFKGAMLNPDVFIYYAEMVCDTNETFVLKGNVTLLK
jgi:gliding motility-associated-like protein